MEPVPRVALFRQIHPADGPAQDIEFLRCNSYDTAIGNRHQGGALGPSLLDMPALDIAGKEDQGIAGDDLPLMNMPQRPVVIAL